MIGNHRGLVQYLVAGAVSMAAFTCGLQNGWVSPGILKLFDENECPFRPIITKAQASMIGSIFCIGCIVGSVSGITLPDKIGRKTTIQLSFFPNISCYICIYFASHLNMIYLAKFLGGISIGMIMATLPTYLSEISTPKVRGILSTFLHIQMNLGLVLTSFAMEFVSLKTEALLAGAYVIVQTLLTFFIYETPNYYIMKNSRTDAEISLRRLRQSSNVEDELQEIEDLWKENQKHSSGLSNIVKSQVNRKALTILIVLALFQQITGLSVLLTFASLIFKKANMTVREDRSTTLLFLTCFVMTLVTASIIDNWGRKPLYIASTVIGGIFLALLGIFFSFLNADPTSVTCYQTFPLIAVIISMGALVAGLGSVSNLIVTELFTTDLRASASAIFGIASYLVGSCFLIIFEKVWETYGLEYSLWMVSGLCGIASVYALLALPETKGYALEEIQRKLIAGGVIRRASLIVRRASLGNFNRRESLLQRRESVLHRRESVRLLRQPEQMETSLDSS